MKPVFSLHANTQHPDVLNTASQTSSHVNVTVFQCHQFDSDKCQRCRHVHASTALFKNRSSPERFSTSKIG